MDAIYAHLPVVGPVTSRKVIERRRLQRVLDAIIWMRSRGVPLIAQPGGYMTSFYLSPVPFPPSPVVTANLSDEIARIWGDDVTDVGSVEEEHPPLGL